MYSEKFAIPIILENFIIHIILMKREILFTSFTERTLNRIFSYSRKQNVFLIPIKHNTDRSAFKIKGGGGFVLYLCVYQI